MKVIRNNKLISDRISTEEDLNNLKTQCPDTIENIIPKYRDWWTEAAFISHWFPGFGNPWKLSLCQWNTLLARIEDIVDYTSKATTMEEQMLKEARRIIRIDKRKNSYKVT